MEEILGNEWESVHKGGKPPRLHRRSLLPLLPKIATEVPFPLVWSNDAYESVEHRAIVNSEKERFSIPYFFFPAHDTEVKPLEELINEKSPSKYRPYKSGKFLLSRMNSNFKKQTEENLQIHYYKLV